MKLTQATPYAFSIQISKEGGQPIQETLMAILGLQLIAFDFPIAAIASAAELDQFR
jgi:hypothetical protein